MPKSPILHVAIKRPFRHCIDYLPPAGFSKKPLALKPGIRLLVPFGRQKIIAVLLKVDQKPCIPYHKLRPALAVLDKQPLLPEHLLSLCQWASRYYLYPVGEVILGALPRFLRTNAEPATTKIAFKLNPSGHGMVPNALKRAPKQAALLALFQSCPEKIILRESLIKAGFRAAQIKQLCQKGGISVTEVDHDPLQSTNHPNKHTTLKGTPLRLNSHQQKAVNQIISAKGTQVFLIEGVTGSGKTEVYLQAIAPVLKTGKQVLVLVPEIGLTPQSIARFQERFGYPIIALHSRLLPKERYAAWMRICTSAPCIVIGTRSCIFAPFVNLGIIVVDEAHDLSFKQQKKFCYSARDLAIVRGRLENIPVLLGSATPDLESLQNAYTGRFQHIKLPKRAGGAKPPTFRIIDMRNKKLAYGFSQALLICMEKHLKANQQVLIFLNRRGYAPILMCPVCGKSANCIQCDARLVLHHAPDRLLCHLCLKSYPVVTLCTNCKQATRLPLGSGTQRIEAGLRKLFPHVPIIRMDKDTTTRKGELHNALNTIQNAKNGHILIGTQMLAKGHHFPHVTLVAILDMDMALYSTDFRATEHMGQLIIQVAGRAGRAHKPGEVLLQTHLPTHPLLQTLVKKGYTDFAHMLLKSRKACRLPPFYYLCLLQVLDKNRQKANHFLKGLKAIIEKTKTCEIDILGPIPAPVEKKAGYYRARLLFQSQSRNKLHNWLHQVSPQIDAHALSHRVKWSLDVDFVVID